MSTQSTASPAGTPAAAANQSTIMPSMRYHDAPAAMDWLCQVIGFTRHAVYANPDGTIAHAELTLGGGMIMLGSEKSDEYGRGFKPPRELGAETRGVYVVVPNPDEIFARAQAANAAIVRPLQDMEYGSREFTLKDPEGHSWSLGTYNPWEKHQ